MRGGDDGRIHASVCGPRPVRAKADRPGVVGRGAMRYRAPMPALRIIVFGATGMVGTGVLRECLLDPDVAEVLSIGRTSLGPELLQRHPKLRERVVSDLTDYRPLVGELAGWDACFFCLGVSAAGLSEDAYTRVTYDVTLAAARALSAASPGLVFVYVSGAGTDSSEKGRSMWARVKGKTENALLAMPFKAAFMFRPGLIQPVHGARSKTALYRRFYAVATPLFPLMRLFAGRHITTTEVLGRAMLAVVKRGAPATILHNRDINALGRATGPAVVSRASVE